MTLVENLRKYVGEQGPLEARSQAWETERQELLDTVQVGEYRVWVWRETPGIRLGDVVTLGGEHSP